MNQVARSVLSVLWVVSQAPTRSQSPVPILEWGPGLAARWELMLTTAGTYPVAGDIDNDGDVDFVCRSGATQSVLITVLRNDGRGGLVSEIVPPPYSQGLRAQSLALGDIDGDGDLDIVMPGQWLPGSGADRPYVFINDGTGHFAIDGTRFPRAPAVRAFPACVDIDRDGDVDVVFGGQPFVGVPGGVEIWINDGRGYFVEETAMRLPAGVDCDALATGDLDGDGAPEIVLGQGNSGFTPKRILWNDGIGFFFRVQTLPPNDSVLQAFVVDVDLDGDNDIFFKGGYGRLFRNDQGNLVQVPFPTHNPLWAESRAAIGDVNADGYPDIVFSFSGPGRDPTIFLNDGHGRFVETPGWFHGDWRVGLDWMAFADVDGDGDEDVFAAGLWAPPFYPPGRGAVLFNLWRQVWGFPVVQRGSTHQIEVCGRPGTGFALALSAQRAAVPIDLGALGAWHLDLAASVPLGVVVMNVGGQGSVPLRIPNVPFLRNNTFYTQGFDLDAGTRLLHATGWWSVHVL